MDFDRFFIVHQISILGHILFSLRRLCSAAVHRRMIIVGCLPHDFDIRYYIRAYSPPLDEISFVQ